MDTSVTEVETSKVGEGVLPNLNQVAVISVEDVIATTLVKNNITETILSALEAESKEIVINGVSDKEGIKKADAFRKKAKEIKIAANKICIAGREEAIEISKKWIETQKKVAGRAETVEKEWETKLDNIEAEKLRIAEEEKKKEQLRIQARTKAVIDSGCVYDGLKYTIAACEITDEKIKTCPDDIFEIFLSNVKVEHQKQLDAAAETERLRLLEVERLAEVDRENERLKAEEEKRQLELQKENERIRLENEKIAAEQKEKAAELERREAALKKKEVDDMVNARIAECQKLNLKWSNQYEYYVLHGVNVGIVEIKTLDNVAWTELYAKLTVDVPKAVKEYEVKQKEIADAQEAKRLKEIEDAKIESAKKARFDLLKSIGYTYPLDDLGTMAESSWMELFETHNKAYQKKVQDDFIEKQKKDAIAAENEKLRVAALATDKEKLTKFADDLSKMVFPEVNSDAAKTVVKTLQSDIQKARQFIESSIKKLA